MTGYLKLLYTERQVLEKAKGNPFLRDQQEAITRRLVELEKEISGLETGDHWLREAQRGN